MIKLIIFLLYFVLKVKLQIKGKIFPFGRGYPGRGLKTCGYSSSLPMNILPTPFVFRR
jgi:hypothetical protein